jgi:hypothetical protein
MKFTELSLTVRNRVNQLREENTKPLIIKVRLREEYNIRVSVSDIKSWFDFEKVEPKIEVIEARPIVLNMSEFLARFGINNLETPDDVINAVQTLTQQVFLLESAIRVQKLQQHIEKGEKYPNDSKAYRNAFEVFSQAIALKDIVSVRQAIRTIENEGYTIRMIEESE